MANDMPVAPMAPKIIWPWPPMLNRPARAGIDHGEGAEQERGGADQRLADAGRVAEG